MNSKVVFGVAAVSGLLYFLLHKKATAVPEEIIVPEYPTSPDYMNQNPEYPETYHSSDDNGGTAFYELNTHLPISRISRGGPLRPRGRNRREIEVNYPTFTGGTYLHPELLPPMQEARIGAGRFAHPELLGPMQEARLQ